jgi:hypothetical protein
MAIAMMLLRNGVVCMLLSRDAAAKGVARRGELTAIVRGVVAASCETGAAWRR